MVWFSLLCFGLLCFGICAVCSDQNEKRYGLFLSVSFIISLSLFLCRSICTIHKEFGDKKKACLRNVIEYPLHVTATQFTPAIHLRVSLTTSYTFTILMLCDAMRCDVMWCVCMRLDRALFRRVSHQCTLMRDRQLCTHLIVRWLCLCPSKWCYILFSFIFISFFFFYPSLIPIELIWFRFVSFLICIRLLVILSHWRSFKALFITLNGRPFDAVS